jgi:hypothetical protein
MSISNDQTRKYIQNLWGSDGLAAITNAEKIICAKNEKIQFLFRIIQDDFVLLNSQNVKKETLTKAVDELTIKLWKPVIQDETDEKGNFIINLQPTQELFRTAKKFNDMVDLFMKTIAQSKNKNSDQKEEK